MIRIKSSKYDNIIVCNTEDTANIELWNSVEIKTQIEGKEISIIIADDDDAKDIMSNIHPTRYLDIIKDRASFMHTIALAIIERFAKDAIINLLNGSKNIEELETAFKRDTEFDREVWDHASNEVRRQLLAMMS